MNPLNLIPAPYRIWGELILIGIVVAALTGSLASFIHHERQLGRDETRRVWEAAAAAQKADAARLLAEETAKVHDAEQKLNDLKQRQEQTDVQNTQVVADLSRKLASVRLRDPGRRGESGGSTQGQAARSAGAGGADPAQDAGVLSDRAAEFLRRFAADADAINDAYISCRQDAMNIRNP